MLGFFARVNVSRSNHGAVPREREHIARARSGESVAARWRRKISKSSEAAELKGATVSDARSQLQSTHRRTHQRAGLLACVVFREQSKHRIVEAVEASRRETAPKRLLDAAKTPVGRTQG